MSLRREQRPHECVLSLARDFGRDVVVQDREVDDAAIARAQRARQRGGAVVAVGARLADDVTALAGAVEAMAQRAFVDTRDWQHVGECMAALCEFLAERAQQGHGRTWTQAVARACAGAVAEHDLFAHCGRDRFARHGLHRGDASRSVGERREDVVRVAVERLHERHQRLRAMRREQQRRGGARALRVAEGERRLLDGHVAARRLRRAHGRPGRRRDATGERSLEPAGGTRTLPVEEKRTAHRDIAGDAAHALVVQRDQHEQRVLVDEEGIPRAFDEEIALEHAVLQRAARREARREAMVGAELAEQRQRRRHLRDRSRVHRALGRLRHEHAAVLGLDVHALFHADQRARLRD